MEPFVAAIRYLRNNFPERSSDTAKVFKRQKLLIVTLIWKFSFIGARDSLYVCDYFMDPLGSFTVKYHNTLYL